jgi:hypothetical protein
VVRMLGVDVEHFRQIDRRTFAPGPRDDVAQGIHER